MHNKTFFPQQKDIAIEIDTYYQRYVDKAELRHRFECNWSSDTMRMR